MFKKLLEILKRPWKNFQESSTVLRPETPSVHDVRHGLVGVYVERKRLLSAMVSMSNTLDEKKKWNKMIPSKVRYKLYRSLIEQMGSVNRMDEHLYRVEKACRRKE